MRYHALACDYDGTIAENGTVSRELVAALERLRATGRMLILVTGRQLEDLLEVFPHVTLFDRVVAENGAVLYHPATYEEKTIGEPPPQEFVDTLRERGVPLSVGHVIAATWEPHQTAIMQAIHDLGLELHVIFNKGAVMVLPSGVNKSTGLKHALYDLELSSHNTVGVGDAENDHAFLSLCECSAAVANALPSVKRHVDMVTEGERGTGVIELVDKMISTDLVELEPRLGRHELLIGTREDGSEVKLQPYDVTVLVSGSSGSGKSTFATGFMEQLAKKKYQFCIIDPEGDYDNLEGAVVIGGTKSPPILEGGIRLLERYDQNVVLNLLGLSIGDRPEFFREFLLRLQELRARTGRPHWIVLDEAHHLLPLSMNISSLAFCQSLYNVMLITVHPAHVSPLFLSSAQLIIAVGESPHYVFADFARLTGQAVPELSVRRLESGEAVAWFRRAHEAPFKIRTVVSHTAHQRHLRKYANGMLGPDKSFYFRGPEGRLNLRAHNLIMFVQMADGVDDGTWLYHLKRGDISRWLRLSVKDDVLASYAERIEGTVVPPRESRAMLKKAIEERYTAPA